MGAGIQLGDGRLDDPLCNVHIDREGQVRTMLLGGGQGQDRNGSAGIDAAKVLGGQVGPLVDVM